MSTNNKGQATRLKLIKAGAKLIHRQGYNHTGLQQVLQEAGVPKGSFYFHFKNKQDFGQAVIHYFGELFTQMAQSHLLNKKLEPAAKLKAFHLGMLDAFKQWDYQCGCPIGNLGQELSDLDSHFQHLVKQALDSMTRLIADVIAQGQRQGCFNSQHNPNQLAAFFVNSWEGSLIRMKADASPVPLNQWFEFMQQLLQPPHQETP